MFALLESNLYTHKSSSSWILNIFTGADKGIDPVLKLIVC